MNYSQHKQALQYFDHQDGKIAYIDQGQGPCILLIHGVPTSSWLYRNIISILVNRGYRVVAPDMLGFGSSEKPAGYEIYSYENTGKRIHALMQHLNITSWTHVCHDGGGLWTWAMMQQNASPINRLILLNTIVYKEGFKPPIRFEQGFIAKKYSSLYSSKLGQSIVLNPTFKNGVNNKSIIDNEVLGGYKKPLLKNGHYAMYYFFTQTCNRLEDYRGLHRLLNIPTCIIWGKKDNILVWEKIKNQVLDNFNLKNEDIHVLDAKHFIQEEHPEQIAGIINEFVQKLLKN